MSSSVVRPHPHTRASDFCCKQRPELVPPEPPRLVANGDAALVQRDVGVSQRWRGPDLHRHGRADDFMRGLEVAPGHRVRARLALHRLDPVGYDST